MPERGKIYFILVDFPYPPLENVKINSLVYWINDISGSRPPLFPPILGKRKRGGGGGHTSSGKKRLKGQCHEIFNTFVYQKTLPGPHMNTQKRFHRKIYFQK